MKEDVRSFFSRGSMHHPKHYMYLFVSSLVCRLCKFNNLRTKEWCPKQRKNKANRSKTIQHPELPAIEKPSGSYRVPCVIFISVQVRQESCKLSNNFSGRWAFKWAKWDIDIFVTIVPDWPCSSDILSWVVSLLAKTSKFNIIPTFLSNKPVVPLVVHQDIHPFAFRCAGSPAVPMPRPGQPRSKLWQRWASGGPVSRRRWQLAACGDIKISGCCQLMLVAHVRYVQLGELQLLVVFCVHLSYAPPTWSINIHNCM